MREWQSILTSYPDSCKINAVSEGAETLYTRLIAKADNLGRADATPRSLMGLVYARRPQITERILEARLRELEREGLIVRYGTDADPVLAITNVTRQGFHSSITLKSTFPAPPVHPSVGLPLPFRPPSAALPPEKEKEIEKEIEIDPPPTPRNGQGVSREGMVDLIRFEASYQPISSEPLRKALTEWGMALAADPRFKAPRGPQARRWLNLLLRWGQEGVSDADLTWAVGKATEGGHRGCWGKLVDPRELPRPQNGVHREDEKARKKRESIEEMERKCRETRDLYATEDAEKGAKK